MSTDASLSVDARGAESAEVVGGLIDGGDVARTADSNERDMCGEVPQRVARGSVTPSGVTDPEPVVVDKAPRVEELRPMEESEAAERKAVDPRSRELHRLDPFDRRERVLLAWPTAPGAPEGG